MPPAQLTLQIAPGQLPKVQLADPTHGVPDAGSNEGQRPLASGAVGIGDEDSGGGFELGSPSPHASVVATTTNEGAKSLALECLPLIPGTEARLVPARGQPNPP